MNKKLRHKLTALVGISLAVLSANSLAQSGSGAISADDLLDALVQQGVLTRAKADEIKQKAERKLRNDYGAAVEKSPGVNANVRPESTGDVVRVPYVPQYIKDEIRSQVRMELREEVVGDVMAQAKKEGWGLPNTQEDWTKVMKWSGDIRVRLQGDTFPSDNDEIFDYNEINSNGSFSTSREDKLNTDQDRYRLRLRARLGMKAKPSQGVEIGTRLVTGSANDPVSTNSTFGNGLKKHSVAFDRAYFKYNTYIKDWEFTAGRMANPWFSTDLVWDTDVNFDGLVVRWNYLRSDNPLMEMVQSDPYVTVGVFPLEEIERESNDKWLYGIQAGYIYNWFNQNSLHVSLGYYHYENIDGEFNTVPGSDLTDYSAPAFMQRGNSLFTIRTPLQGGSDVLYALASEYRELNLTAVYDIAVFAPYHVYIIADYVKNIGYDDKEVAARVNIDDYDAGDTGYQFKVAFGWPTTVKPGDWQVSFAYKHLERDAVLDAYTDSDFHLGGTDAEGYVLEGSYSVLKDVWMTLKYLSASEVDLNPDPLTASSEGRYGVDVLQLDLNATF
jgi:hypothetical protein